MPEPVVTSLIVGVAANLASNVVQAQGSRITNTRVGRRLSKLGLIKPGFDERLRRVVSGAVQIFLEENRQYNLNEIHSFLESKPLAKDIREMLLEQRGLNAPALMERLETYVGIPLLDAPDSWPNRIDPKLFVEQLFKSFKDALGEQADEGLLWMSTSLGEHGLILKDVSQKLDKLLEESPSALSENEADEFLDSYRQHLLSRARRVSTPGARELRGINQSLSVAYISLNLKSTVGSEAVRAEEFLSQHSCVAIRGPAGSGKTTLLNWLITKCNGGDTDQSWSRFVPFLVPLRKVARLHQGPPTVENLVEYSVDNQLWAQETPPNWIRETLSKKNGAILMIDGVDELPSSRRAEFWDWVDGFTREYPHARIIITSRVLPGAPTDGSFHEEWNPPASFVNAQLQDMSDADVTNFVHHWHDSIDGTRLEEQELQSLKEARASLPSKLEDAANRRIRELCNTPLLCAMICVLHWKEEGYLPAQRVEVYERCCDMLIEARDTKRGVTPPPGAISAMSKSDKEMVLQQLAIEMMHNSDDIDADMATDDSYRIEISREKALTWIEPLITRFQSPEGREASAVEVLDFLVERTGLLREPAKDLIDFPHRTFQEYLAACAAGAGTQEAMLAKQVDDDQWHETIMLAAGTSTGGVGFGQRLISTLIKRGERHTGKRERSLQIRKTCFALALGCLENLRQQEESLRTSVLAHLGELVPPRNEVDARILSVAGDAAVSHLSYVSWQNENTGTVAACARALRLIGTTEALRAIGRGYLADSRPDVASEVCRTDNFPYDTIPAIVEAVKRTGAIPDFASYTDLNLLLGLEGLKIIGLDVSETKGLERIGNLNQLESAFFQHLDEESSFLSGLPQTITAVRLQGSGLPKRDWVGRLPHLDTMTTITLSEEHIASVIDGAAGLTNLSILVSDFRNVEAVHKLEKLNELRLSALSELESVESLKSHPSLKNLTIEECPQLHTIDLSDGFNQLTSLHVAQPGIPTTFGGRLGAGSDLRKLQLIEIERLEDLAAFEGATDLEALELLGCGAIRDLSAIEKMQNLLEIDLASLRLVTAVTFPAENLERLSLNAISSVNGDSFGDGLAHAKSVKIARCPKIDDIEFLRKSANLDSLSLALMPRISSLEPLKGKSTLTALSLVDCDGIESLQDIIGLPIEELSLFSMQNVQDFEIIGSLAKLRTLSIFNCEGLEDLSFATELEALETIWLPEPDDAILIPEALAPKVSYRRPNGIRYFHHLDGIWRDNVWPHRYLTARRWHGHIHIEA